MNRRTLTASVLGLTAAPVGRLLVGPTVRRPAAAAPGRTVQLQTSPLAGFQFHAGEAVWPGLAVGHPLQVGPGPADPFDANVVRVDWRGRKLGYLPCDESTAVAQLLDRGERLQACIEGLANERSPWRRMRLVVELEVA